MFPLIANVVGGLTNTPYNRIKTIAIKYDDGTSIVLEGPSADVFFSELATLLRMAMQALYMQKNKQEEDENSPAFLGSNFREHVKKLEDSNKES